MLKTRVIPTLLWKDHGLVKGKSFDSWRRVGTVLPVIKVYNIRQVDELILVDITATKENRCSMLQDLMKGKKTEINSICGEVVKKAEPFGIQTPINSTLLTIVIGISLSNSID